MTRKSFVRGKYAKLLLAFYGDDFTGSTDALEALATAGIRTVLFLKQPTNAQLARFTGLRAFGVAGSSRTMSPKEMGVALPAVLRALQRSGAPIIHYKVCSTFDSSPEIGSIGHVIDLAQRIFRSRTIPLLVGAPVLGRFCVFGNLFARSGLDSEPFRLDRHPTMRQHPITPMRESDLRLHLARQTAGRIELFDLLKLESIDPDSVFDQLLKMKPRIMLFDVLADRHLPIIGRLISRLAEQEAPLFMVGSSGVEYALKAFWKIGKRPTWKIRPADQILAISGSCSPVTERQIRYALDRGFVEVPLNPAKLLNTKLRNTEFDRCVTVAVKLLHEGRSVILHTSLGPADARVNATRRALARAGLDSQQQRLKSSRLIGPILGRILLKISNVTEVSRVVIAGGDTSWFVASELGIEALEMLAPIAPGSPLCRVHSRNGRINQLEVVFKGGQVGHDDFFVAVLRGLT